MPSGCRRRSASKLASHTPTSTSSAPTPRSIGVTGWCEEDPWEMRRRCRSHGRTGAGRGCQRSCCWRAGNHAVEIRPAHVGASGIFRNRGGCRPEHRLPACAAGRHHACGDRTIRCMDQRAGSHLSAQAGSLCSTWQHSRNCIVPAYSRRFMVGMRYLAWTRRSISAVRAASR